MTTPLNFKANRKRLFFSIQTTYLHTRLKNTPEAFVGRKEGWNAGLSNRYAKTLDAQVVEPLQTEQFTDI